MIKKITYALVVAVLLLPFISTTVMAAYNDVTATDSTAVVYLSDTDANYTINSNIEVESFIVNTGSVVATMLAGSNIKLVSTNRHTLTFSGIENCSGTFTCESGESWAEVSCNAAGTHTVTITASATTCSAPTAGGTPSFSTPAASAPSGSSPAAAATTPVAATPAATTPVVVTTPAATGAVITTPAEQTTPTFEETNPASPIQFSNIAATSFLPGDPLRFTYQYKNEKVTKAKVKIIRQLVNSRGRTVKQSTASTTLKPGSIYVRNISEAIGRTLAAGEYTVKVKTLDAKTNRLLDENSFKIEVERLKKKVFSLGDVSAEDNAIAFDAATLAKIVSNKTLPANFKVKYSYTNYTNAKQKIKMVRELLSNSTGKAVAPLKQGNWIMVPGEKDSATFTQAVAGNLLVGSYTIRIRAYNKGTNQILAENSIGFVIELK